MYIHPTQEYSAAGLTDTQQSTLDVLRHLGLIYQKKVSISKLEKIREVLPYPSRHFTFIRNGNLIQLTGCLKGLYYNRDELQDIRIHILTAANRNPESVCINARKSTSS
jgi:hypothetical protein